MGGEAKKRTRGRPKAVDAGDLKALKAIVDTQPDISLRSIADVMAERSGKRLTPATWSRALSQLGLAKVRAGKTIQSSATTHESKATRYRPIHRREPAPGRYPSSLTDHEWEALRPLIENKRGRGRPAFHERRLMWDAVFYLVRSGASWRMLPADFPSYKAVSAFFARARQSGLLEQIYDRLHALWREKWSRNPTPSAGSVDSQSVKTTEKGGSVVSTRARR